MVGGRPGIALAYAHAPDALRLRGELGRTLLDLLDATPAARLAAMRAAMPQALALAADLERGAAAARSDADRRRPDAAVATDDTGQASGRAKGPTAAAVRAPKVISSASEAIEDADEEVDPDAPVRAVPAPLRRRAAEALVLVWTEVARDLALVAAGGAASVHDPAMLEETAKAAEGLAPDAAVEALRRLERAGTLIAANVSPELVLDALAIAWPRRRRAIAA